MNKHITLCKPGREPVCVLNGVDLNTVDYTQKFNDLDEITFVVDKYIEDSDGEKIISAGYDKLHAFMEIYVDEIGYFQIKEPEISNEINKETKTVTGVSIATELLQKDLVGFTVNTSTTASLEMLADNNINSLGYPDEYITFYNPTNKQLSLLDLILEKAVGWSVGAIDDFLKNQRYSFDNINENIFSFLTKTLSSTARCIFVFDTINKTVSAYSENHIGNNTGIVVAERNLLNSVDVQCDSDNIYTRLNVQGKDSLTFADINYGDTHIFNLDYYSNLDYMNQDLIDALERWQNARDSGRDAYISDVTAYQSYLEQISEIDNKVPTNGVLNNWDNMSMDELSKNLTYYNSLIKELQIVAQNTHPKPGETEYVGNLDDYSPSRLKTDGTVDHEAYMNDLDGQGKETYREVITYVIPNIEIAIGNFDLTKDDKQDYLEDYLTDWSLYGLVELKAKKSSYEDQIGTLKTYKKEWGALTDEEKLSHGNNESTYTQYHNEYSKISGYLSDIEDKYTELSREKEDLVSSKEKLSVKLETTREDMAITGSGFQGLTKKRWFTDEQIEILTLLFHDTDYTNENILITKLDDFEKRLEIEQELYDDAERELSELSVPQYTFSCSLDNLLSMGEFSCWHNDFKVGNFITLEVGKGVFTKLRLISISYNPFTKTNDLTVEFSNITTSKDGRNDFSYIFDKAISASKNSITLSNNSAKDDIELSIEMLNLLSNSSVFQGKFDNLNLKSAVISEAAIVKLTADFAKITELDAKYATIESLNATNATITELNANVANIEKAYIKKVEADEIYAKTADVDTLLAGYVKSDVASIGTLFYKVGLIDRSTTVEGHITGFLDAVEINANSITAGTLVADRILLKAPEGSSQKGLLYAINKFGNVESTSVDTIDGNILTDRTITADKLIANSITANELDVDKIFGSEAVLNKIVSQQIFSDAVSANNLVVSANANALEALNQQIGGRNIVTGTKELKIGYGGHSKGHWKKDGATGTIQTIDISDDSWKSFTHCLRLTSTDSTVQIRLGQCDIPLDKNSYYTMSCWVRSNSSVGVPIRLQPFYKSNSDHSGNTQNIIITDEWTYVSFTSVRTPTATDSYNGAYVYLYPTAVGNYIDVCGIKLEKGNKATDWSPAPEDIDSSISAASIANWCYNNDTTYIDGGNIYAKTITTEQLNVDHLSAITTNLGTVKAGTIESGNYVKDSEGMKLSLTDGSWDSVNFKIDATGNITATGGILGGWSFDGKIMKKLLVEGTTAAEKRYVFINTKVTTGSWDGTTLVSPKGRVLGINAEINENIGTQMTVGTAGALYINADGSMSATSSDRKATFRMSNGSVTLEQTKTLPSQNEETYRCLAQGNVLTFYKPDADGKPPKNGYMHVGEVANEVFGTLGLHGTKGIFSDTENLYIATSKTIYLKATEIDITGTLNSSLNGNASTATKLETARTISLTGSVTGSGKFDGSGNLSISTTTNHTHNYLPLSGGNMSGNILTKTTDSYNLGSEGSAFNSVYAKTVTHYNSTKQTYKISEGTNSDSKLYGYLSMFYDGVSQGGMFGSSSGLTIRPSTNGVGSIGTSLLRFSSAYIDTINSTITKGAISTISGTITKTATISYQDGRNKVLLMVKDNSRVFSNFVVIPISNNMTPIAKTTLLYMGSNSISYSVSKNGVINITLSDSTALSGSSYVALFYSET